MSAIIETFLKCDARNNDQCQDTFGVDTRGQNKGPTIAQHRIDAKEAGWKFRAGEDFCPVCYALIKKATATRLMYKYRDDNQ